MPTAMNCFSNKERIDFQRKPIQVHLGESPTLVGADSVAKYAKEEEERGNSLQRIMMSDTDEHSHETSSRWRFAQLYHAFDRFDSEPARIIMQGGRFAALTAFSFKITLLEQSDFD